MSKYLIIFAVSVLGAFAFPNERIFGGSDAPNGSFPYVVSLMRFSHMCGGSIIGAYTILTAGHCIRDITPPWLTVVAGTHTLDMGGERHAVSEFKVHPLGDIGLVILKEPLQFSNNIQPIALEEENNDDVRNCVVCGWGQTSTSSPPSNYLQYLKLRTLTNSDCLSHETSIRDDDICTLPKVGEGICYGDSGSPLVAENKQIGIVSRGASCAIGRPDIYTRVSYFIEWIRENRKQ